MERRKPRRESVVERLFKSAIHNVAYDSSCNVSENKTEKHYNITLNQPNRKILNCDGFDMNMTDTLDEKSNVTVEIDSRLQTSTDQNAIKKEIGFYKINQEIDCDEKKQETLEDSQNTLKGESGSSCVNSFDAELKNATKQPDIMKMEHKKRSVNLNMFKLPMDQKNDQNFPLDLPIHSKHINKFNMSCKESFYDQNISNSPHEVTEHVQCVRSKTSNSSLYYKSYYSSKNAAKSSILSFVNRCETQSIPHRHESKDKSLCDSANSGSPSLSQKSPSSTYQLHSRRKSHPGFQQNKPCVPILASVSKSPLTITINNIGKFDENPSPKQKFSKSCSESFNVLRLPEERNCFQNSLDSNLNRTHICGHRRSRSEFVRPVTSLSSMFSTYNIDHIPSCTDNEITDHSCYSPLLYQQDQKGMETSFAPSCTYNRACDYNVTNQEINYSATEKETLKDFHVTSEISARFPTSTDSNSMKREIGHNATKPEIDCKETKEEALDNSLNTSKDKSSSSCKHSVYGNFKNELNECRFALTSDHHELFGSNTNYHNLNSKSLIHSNAADVTPYSFQSNKSNMTFIESYCNKNICNSSHKVTDYVHYLRSKNNLVLTTTSLTPSCTYNRMCDYNVIYQEINHNGTENETLKDSHVTKEISAQIQTSTDLNSMKREIGHNETKQKIDGNKINEETLENSLNTLTLVTENELNECMLPLISDHHKLCGSNNYHNLNFKSQIHSDAADITPSTTQLSKSNMAFMESYTNQNMCPPHKVTEYIQYFKNKNTDDPSKVKNSSQSATNFSVPAPSYTYNKTWVYHERPYSPSPNQKDLEKMQTSLPQYISWNLNNFKSDVGFIDSHCCLDFLFQKEGFCGTFAEYREQHRDSFPRSFKGCVAVFCNPFTFQGNMWKYLLDESNIWAAIGCHPHYSNQYDEDIDEALINALKHPRVRALGPIGLDYSNRNNCWKQTQHKIFKRQLSLAMERKFPIVIHCREAHTDALNIVKETVPRDHLIHLHCFTDEWHWALKWLEAFPNLFIGLTNLVTFPSAEDVHEVARYLPLDRLLLETDAPYFVPRPIRKETWWSHPGMAIHVAAQIAAIKDHIPLDDVLRAVKLNTMKMYGIE